MADFKPQMPFNVPMRLLVPTYTTELGAPKKTFSEPSKSKRFFGSFRTFGGTEVISNDVYTVRNTATINTWFDPDIKSDCEIYIETTGETYEIKGKTENVAMRNQWLQIKVEAIEGGA